MAHVGSHPGNGVLLVCLGLGAAAGLQRDWGNPWGAMGGAGFMALFMVPLYLKGAYDRALMSESLEERETKQGGAKAS